MDERIKEVLSYFPLEGKVLHAERYGEGHINDTYLVICADGDRQKKYILQRITDKLFSDVPLAMRNIELVTEFIQGVIKERGGNPYRESLQILRAVGGKSYYFDGNRYYRVYHFIEGATSKQSADKPEYFFEAAVAFGNFVNLLTEFDAKQLTETIPNFHNTTVRYDNFIKAVNADTGNRAASVAKEIKWVTARKKYAASLVELLNSGAIPYRVTHNDTKLNNVMLDDITGKGIAVIDLDTVMPGSLCYDFGDAIRFGCNSAAEDERDLDKVWFRLDLFEIFVKGYLGAVGSTITKAETANLAKGAIVMTYECGMRFLTDYLSGDTYFKTHRDGHNLDRARTQFKLVEEMERVYEKMCEIVKM